MANDPESVALGELLSDSNEWIRIEPDRTYKEVKVKLWGKGILLRREVSGSDIQTPKKRVVRRSQFVLSRIDARNGALGLVPADLDGAIVSNDFPSFDLRTGRLLPEYLDWMAKTRWFTDLCKQASEGTTNRVRLQEERFLRMKIPLPPLSEQRRIVEKIDRLASHLSEARSLRHQIVEEAERLCRSIVMTDKAAKPTPMRELVRLRQPDVIVRPEESYQFAGVYCFGRGVFRGQSKTGMDFAYPRLTRLQTGNFVYPKLMAWEGALGVVPPECDGCVVSTEFPVFEVIEDRVLPEVLDVYFRAPTVWPELSGASTGTNVRRRRLNPSDFLGYRMPLPSRDTQHSLREVRVQVDALKRLQSETAAELDALLPSILDKAFRGEL